MPNVVTLTMAKGLTARVPQLVFAGHDNFVVGREEDCRCRIADDPAVSDYHCVIEVNPPEIRVRDLSSTTGTWVNGRRIAAWDENKSEKYGMDLPYPGVDLREGDVIRVGRTELTVETKTDELPGTVICRSCGADVTGEVNGRTGDYYFCLSCREAISLDPEKRLLVAVGRASGTVAHDSAWDETVGEVAGCRVIRPLGRNPFGMVYLAERISDGLEVALKIVLPHVAVSEASHRKYLEDVGTMKGVRHNQIVELVDAGSLGGAFYFVTECCAGTNILNAYLTAGIKEWQLWCRMSLSQAVEGLVYAHGHGMVHGHLRISNILIGGTPDDPMGKIGDLGLAREFDAEGFGGMTLTGLFAKAPFFIPRERILDPRRVDPLSDLWTIGAINYTLHTKRPVYNFAPGIDPLAVILKGETVPVRKCDPTVPLKLADVIDKSVQTNPRDRFAKAHDLQMSLACELMFPMNL